MKRIIFIIISIAAIGLFLIGMKPKISPLVSSFDKDGYVTFSENGVNLLFDTGANITLLYTDTVPESFYPFVRTDAKDIGDNDFSVEIFFVLCSFGEYRREFVDNYLIAATFPMATHPWDYRNRHDRPL